MRISKTRQSPEPHPENLTQRVSHGKGALMEAGVHNSVQDVCMGHLLGGSGLPRCGGELDSQSDGMQSHQGHKPLDVSMTVTPERPS